jgi:hypothetical protein
MELPIFRELESAWFRPPTAPGSGPPATPLGTEQPVAPQDRPAEDGRGVEGAPADGPDSRESDVPVPAASAAAAWQTSADEGWDAASALAEEHDFTTTTTGLPKRVPMSQLVPGGVEKGTVSAHKRTPEAVRGLLSAYHRGVQRGRTDKTGDSKTPEHTTAGPQGSQGGKEHEA